MNTDKDEAGGCIVRKNQRTKSSFDIVQFRIKNDMLISHDQAAEYLADILSELRVLAASSNLKFLAALIEVAVEEARLQARPKKTYADIA